MCGRGIDVLVTKNSGGPLTEGKLDAARDLGIPVVMVSRPAAAAAESATTVSDAVSWVLALARRAAPAGSAGE
jgi:precorrin-6A/cobalt-precorrin-6A reductase